ncbi:hypothetical protein EVAR_24424_1 [Eumeta japonica]|uniref:Uncharacterized protein n=1 Tax=Eumeta variegata TaxID=151549 RepID=A0A4C1VUK4_EUMVA|nr:hypothetical protein EVAR_24424_1 [Eumeta japonica]
MSSHTPLRTQLCIKKTSRILSNTTPSYIQRTNVVSRRCEISHRKRCISVKYEGGGEEVGIGDVHHIIHRQFRAVKIRALYCTRRHRLCVLPPGLSVKPTDIAHQIRVCRPQILGQPMPPSLLRATT